MTAPRPPTGYLHARYAQSFANWGSPIKLEHSGGWLLERPVPGAPELRDAMGCYPLYCCPNWQGLESDLGELDDRLVSVTLVPDPTADIEADRLRRLFQHVAPYKDHFLVETGDRAETWVSKSHQRHAIRALRDVEVTVCREPLEYLSDWLRLYSVLTERHVITGLRRLSNETLERQLSVPGLVMFRAAHAGKTIGLDLWYVQGDVAYGHLVAFDGTGYALHASYATKWFLLEWFRDRVRWINLGAGRTADGHDGLGRFKQGFANTIRASWLCGRICNAASYAELARSQDRATTGYFPAYRAGELA